MQKHKDTRNHYQKLFDKNYSDLGGRHQKRVEVISNRLLKANTPHIAVCRNGDWIDLCDSQKAADNSAETHSLKCHNGNVGWLTIAFSDCGFPDYYQYEGLKRKLKTFTGQQKYEWFQKVKPSLFNIATLNETAKIFSAV